MTIRIYRPCGTRQIVRLPFYFASITLNVLRRDSLLFLGMECNLKKNPVYGLPSNFWSRSLLNAEPNLIVCSCPGPRSASSCAGGFITLNWTLEADPVPFSI